MLERKDEERYAEDDSSAERSKKDSRYILRLAGLMKEFREQEIKACSDEDKARLKELERRAENKLFHVLWDALWVAGIRDEDVMLMTIEDAFLNVLDGKFKGGKLESYLKSIALRLLKRKIRMETGLNETENIVRTILKRCERKGEARDSPLSRDEIFEELRKGRVGKDAAWFYSAKTSDFFRNERFYDADGNENATVLSAEAFLRGGVEEGEGGITGYFTPYSIMRFPDKNPILSAFCGDFEEWLVVAVMMLFWDFVSGESGMVKRAFLRERGSVMIELYDYAALHAGRVGAV